MPNLNAASPTWEIDLSLAPPDSTGAHELELSIVLPCLNEAETVGTCVEKALHALREAGIRGEVIVADNGSTDGSDEIARRLGARVVDVAIRGYGSALMTGIAEAQGEYVLMADADDSYDLLEAPKFLAKLREGYDLAQGCRLPAGGGRIDLGAMPWSHRWIGNPLFSLLARWWFSTPINDVYCGMRAFRRTAYDHLEQRCTGMEFATEMIIKASLTRLRIAEVPITLHKDGRSAHAPHVRTMRDGWRTLRFFLMCSPRWLFWAPSVLLVLLGLLGYGIALPGTTIGGVTFDAHTLLFSSLALMCGYQAAVFGILSTTFAVHEGLLPEPRGYRAFYRILNLERGLLLSVLVLLVGLALLLAAIDQWRGVGFGRLDYAQTMRLVIPGATLAVLGFQTVLSSFFVSLLGMRRR